jgi:methionyl-tRNA synthetase
MIERINSDLANNLGNLVNRTLSMQNKYFNGMVANPQEDEAIDEDLKKAVIETVKTVHDRMETLHVADAIQDILDLFSRCNKYIDETAPWTLAKDPDKIARLATVLYNLLESVRIAAVLMEPFLPDTSANILRQLNTKMTSYDDVQEFGKLETDIQITSKPEILFARLDEKEVMAKVAVIEEKQQAAVSSAKQKEEQAAMAEVTINDFQKLDLRVAKVLSCERHPDADKLYVLSVDCGEEKPRQIVSGLAQSYTPGQVIGKYVVVICNLKKAVLRGVESDGMLLAGKDGKEICLVEVNGGLKPGSKVS